MARELRSMKLKVADSSWKFNSSSLATLCGVDVRWTVDEGNVQICNSDGVRADAEIYVKSLVVVTLSC